MAFAFQRTIIEGVYVIEPRVFGDERGYFVEIYHFLLVRQILLVGSNVKYKIKNWR